MQKAKLFLILLITLFLHSPTLADSLIFNVRMWVRDGSTEYGVGGVTGKCVVAYLPNRNYPAQFEEISSIMVTGSSGYLSFVFQKPSSWDDWAWIKLEIYDSPFYIDVDYYNPQIPNSNPRFLYNLTYYPNPPHQNWTTTYFYVRDYSEGEGLGNPYWSDDDSDNIADGLEEELANKFSPVLHKHAYDMQQDLANFEMTLNASSFIYEIDEAYTSPQFSTSPVHRWTSQSGSVHACTQGVLSGVRWMMNIPNGMYHQGAPIGERPIYWHVYGDENYYYVQYWYFFNCNDLRYHNQTMHETYHEGDWEHVELRIQRGTKTPDIVNFYQHYGGTTRSVSSCWWSSSNSLTNNPTQGYSTSRTHLHVYIAANSHASFNRYDPVYRGRVVIAGSELEDYIDNCDYTSYNSLYFKYDFMEKLGEVSHQTEAHGREWEPHYLARTDVTVEWLPYTGYCGAQWWWTGSFPSVDPKATPPPFTPARHPNWGSFSRGYPHFGNENVPSNYLFWQVSYLTWESDPSDGDATGGQGGPKVVH